MGRSLGTEIIYGVKISDEDSGWPYPTDPDTYGHAWPEWVAKDEDGDVEDFAEQVTNRIVRVFTGFSDPEPEYTERGNQAQEKAWDAWYQKMKAAKAQAQVDDGNDEHLDIHYAGVSDYMDRYLGFELFDGNWASPIEPKAIGERVYQGVTNHGWDKTLERAVKALEFQPVEGFDLKPQVLLIATYW
jgi:hypothetical protein